jgi:DNA-binding response OmpR family regulator
MRTILIVDDEPTARYGMRRALEANYKIVKGGTAAEARTLFSSCESDARPDLVLLDVLMPGKGGLAVLRWMRESGYDVPVLIVSALDTGKIVVEALRGGAVDYTVKGFDIDELRARVPNLLRIADLGAENERLRRELVADGQFGRMIGAAPTMRRVRNNFVGGIEKRPRLSRSA